MNNLLDMEKFCVTLGAIEIKIVDFEIISKINDMSTAKFQVELSEWIRHPSLNLLEEIVMINTDTNKRVFTGNIKSIDKELDLIILNLENGVEFSDTYMTGLQTRMPTEELMYAFCRMSGLPHERIQIHGFNNNDKKYVVFIPFTGLKLKTKLILGEYTMLSMENLSLPVPTDKGSELWGEFLGFDGLLSFIVTSRNFYDAETIAIEKADAFLTQYSMMLQYPYSKLKSELNYWKRERQFLHLERSPFALLVQDKFGYSWLHNLNDHNPAQEHDVSNLRYDFETNINSVQSLHRPLTVWNRFRNSNDYLLVTVGFWQVIELLCSDIKLPKRFTKLEIKNLEEKIKHLSEKEQNSLLHAIKNINSRTLDDKFQKFLDNHSLSLIEDDIEVIGKFRKIRNGIEHGKKYDKPSSLEVVRLKSILNYILIASFSVE